MTYTPTAEQQREWELYDQVRRLRVHDDIRGGYVDAVIGWWDGLGYTPSSGEYARAGREAAAGQQARASAPSPGMLAAMAAARGEAAAGSAPPVAAATEPGSIARGITALRLLRREAEQTARSLERVNGGIQS